MNTQYPRSWMQRAAALSHAAALVVLGYLTTPQSAWAAPLVSLSPYPLTVAQPAHPQVLMAVTNSESMDGNLSGAIMAGSGSLGPWYAPLVNSSSPSNYTIPAGFTPPLNPGAAGSAPYTVTDAFGNYVDNSPSRLNVAKAGISAILNSFMSVADFGLIDFSTGWPTPYVTSVYEMSPVGSNFVFTSAQLAGHRYVTNPCFQYLTFPVFDWTRWDCSNIAASGQVTGNVNASQYVEVSTSSDDPLINDVLYAWGAEPVCMVYGGHQPGGIGPDPPTPYPPNYSLAQFNASLWNISESYTTPINGCPLTVYPTNAGFIGDTPEEMYIARGWAYGAWQNVTTSNTVVPMTTSGAIPTAASVNAAIAQFTPFLAPETNNSGTNEIKASAGQSAVPGILAGALNYYSTQNPASSNGCPAMRYVVLVTDGLPTIDLSWGNWPPPGTVSAAGYGMTVVFNPDGTLNFAGTNDQAMKDTVTELQALQAAGIKTYIIGLGAGVDPSVNPVANAALTAMALAGGTGAYFPANSPGNLTTDMNVILAQILAETAATSAVAVNSTGINTKSVVYQGRFTTADTNQDWTGDLLAFSINASTGVVNTAAPLWSGKTQLDAQGWSLGRRIVTWDPVTGAGTPFRWSGGTPASGIATSTALGTALQTFAPDTNGQDVLQFLRGSNAQELSNGGQFRNRTHKLGDIVDSVPLYVSAPSAPWTSASYSAFIAAHGNRAPVVYVGANDGMLHAFDGTTGNPPGHVSGSELFAFIPNGVYSNLISLVNPYYNQNHKFFVDGSPQEQDVQYGNGTWHSLLVSGERSGGKSIFAMDVTDPSTLTTEANVASAVLWEFTDANMGYTYSNPTIAYTAAGFSVFFGNGYDSPTGTPFLYALDPQTGAVQAKIDLCSKVPAVCSGASPNGLSNVTAVNSFGALSAPADVLYAGDLQGNLWRVNISNSNPASWTVSVLYKAKDSLGNNQPITVTPIVTLNPLFPTNTGLMVYFGTGQFLGVPDLGNVQVQSVYGVYDSGLAPAAPLTRAALVQQTMTSSTTVDLSGNTLGIRMLSGNPVNLPVAHGWYVDLSLAAGERIFNDPTLFNGTLQVVSYQPNGSACTAGGTSYYMVFNYATGGATSVPQFDVNGDNKVNSGDLVGGQPVAGIAIAGYASNVVGLRGGGAGGHAYLSYTPPGGIGGGGPGLGGCTGGIGCPAQAVTQGRGAWQELRQ